jgi:hypothetical protein
METVSASLSMKGGWKNLLNCIITPATINVYTVIPAKAGIHEYDWMPDQVRHDNP